MLNYESKMFEDELIAFRKYGVTHIWCVYSKSKVQGFIEQLQRLGYKIKISWCGECCTIEKERK